MDDQTADLATLDGSVDGPSASNVFVLIDVPEGSGSGANISVGSDAHAHDDGDGSKCHTAKESEAGEFFYKQAEYQCDKDGYRNNAFVDRAGEDFGASTDAIGKFRHCRVAFAESSDATVLEEDIYQDDSDYANDAIGNDVQDHGVINSFHC